MMFSKESGRRSENVAHILFFPGSELVFFFGSASTHSCAAAPRATNIPATPS